MNKKDKPIEYVKNKERKFTNEMLNDTMKYQKQYGFDIGKDNVAWNNEADAFRHAYMQSILSKRYTPFIAKRASEDHEKQGQACPFSKIFSQSTTRLSKDIPCDLWIVIP